MARVALPDDVDPRDLDQEARRQLTTLAKDTAELVAQHLVVAGRLMDEDPVTALAHARAARAMGGRVGIVREANGLVAYAAGEWAEALSELRTARRITGQPDHLPVMADCERALGRPDRALMVADDPQASSLDPAGRVELLIVSAGARRDMGQVDAAVVSLQVGALGGAVRPWTSRLRYAYADALLEAGRTAEARAWFSRTAEADPSGETDAVERLLELDGYSLPDADDEADDDGRLDEARHGESAAQTLAAALSSWAERDATVARRGTAGLLELQVTPTGSMDDAQDAAGTEDNSGTAPQGVAESGNGASGGGASGDGGSGEGGSDTVLGDAGVADQDVDRGPEAAVDGVGSRQQGGSASAEPGRVSVPVFRGGQGVEDDATAAEDESPRRPQIPVVLFEAGTEEPEMRLFD